MKKTEWNELYEMHQQITQYGIQTFDTAFLEKYTELFAKSLSGKGDKITHARSEHSVV
jgi:hypothetical protein